MPEIKPEIESFARIKVVGIGGSGCNAVSRMVQKRIKGVEFIGINTDAQALHFCKAKHKILIGKQTTKGLGAGMNVELGKKAAEESKGEIEEALKGADLVFITCGLGGGTGTSGAPIVAEISKSLGALTIGVVTKPFSFEGKKRMEIAEKGYQELKDKVDSLILISNDKILSIVDEKTSLLKAFEICDSVLAEGVQAISDLIVKPGIINLDFADIKTILKDSGLSLMGVGKGKGEKRMEEAVKEAINSPLLDLSIDGAKGVLISFVGGEDLKMKEVEQGAKLITQNVDPEAKIIFGATLDETLKKEEVKVTVIGAGFEEKENFSKESKEKEENSVSNFFEEEKEEDFKTWEIPAFLRKKQK